MLVHRVRDDVTGRDWSPEVMLDENDKCSVDKRFTLIYYYMFPAVVSDCLLGSST